MLYEEEAVDWLDTVPYQVRIERNLLGSSPLWEVGIFTDVPLSGVKWFSGDTLMEAVGKAMAWWYGQSKN